MALLGDGGAVLLGNGSAGFDAEACGMVVSR